MYKIEYLLACIAEEGSEVSQIACKALRFGLNDHAPNSDMSNGELIVKELNDLLAVVEMLKDEGYPLPMVGDRDDIQQKKDKVERFMEYSKRSGHLTDI